MTDGVSSLLEPSIVGPEAAGKANARRRASRPDLSARPVALLALATASPPHVIEQEIAIREAPRVFGRTFDCHPGLIEVFRHAGIVRRRVVRPLEWFATPRDWSERTETYLDGAGELFVAAAEQA